MDWGAKMGRNAIDMTIYKEKLSNRLYKLSRRYVDKKESDRQKQNEQITVRNNEAKKKWKSLLRPLDTCPQEDLIPKYTIEKFCEEVSNTYGVDITYKKYKRYIDQDAFPDDPKLIQALAKTFGVSFEYMYGLSDVENEDTSSIEKLLPINSNAINTLRNLSGHEEAIKILNAILTDSGSCSAEFTNMYEEQYQIYKAKALNHPYDYDTALKRIISAELFANFIEANLLKTEQLEFEQRLCNDLDEESYRADHYNEYSQEIIDALNDYYDSEYRKPEINITSKGLHKIKD